MKKRIMSILLVTILALVVFAGCSKAKEDGSEVAEKYKVAFIARAQSDSFAAWLVNEMETAAKKYPDLALSVFDGQADDEKVNSAIENAIINGYDAIIVQPNNGESQRPYVEQIVDAGIIAITTNARIDGIAGSSSVDADPYVQAAVNAALAVKQIPQNAKVVVLKGPSGNFHADERRDAWQKEFFDKRTDVEIVAEDFANWNKDEAVSLMEDWIIAHGDIDAIIAMNDNMVAGALEVTSGKEGYEDIFSYGVDGTAEAILLIKDGVLTATCLQSAIDLAELNMATVHKLLTGNETEINVDIAAPVITSENVDEYVKIYTDRGLIQ